MNKEIIILSIDDEADIRYALKAIFDFEGWACIMASNVMDGIQLFNKHKPDIVLIDYHMPNINGITGTSMIRDISTSVPILAFTIDESQEVANEFLSAGASDFVLKPIKAPDLISRINLHIRLIQSQKPLERVQNLPKGISLMTLDLIKGHLKDQKKYIDVSEIADGTGLAPQTINRYIQYMVEDKIISMRLNYGRVGRPKQEFSLVSNS